MQANLYGKLYIVRIVWQIIYRTKEKCLAEEIGYVTKKLAKWFGRDSCVKLKQIEAKFNETIVYKTHVETQNWFLRKVIYHT